MNVDLCVRSGRVVMIAGRNGSGKSTLLRVIATAIRPDRGEVLVEGHDVRERREQVRERVAMLGHHPNTYEALTPFENLRLAAGMAGAGANRDELMSLVDVVGLRDRWNDAVSGFSAGMRKRVAFARLLLQTGMVGLCDRSRQASVVLLDEPYGELDPPGFRFVDNLIASFKARGLTVLMATHLLERGASLSDDGIVLEGGQVGWSGRAADLPRQGGLDACDRPEGGA